jgi:hypothetical protein
LHIAVNAAVDDEKSVEVQQMRLADLVPGTIQDPLILFLEVCCKRWTIAAAVTFSGYGNSVVIGFVLWRT